MFCGGAMCFCRDQTLDKAAHENNHDNYNKTSRMLMAGEKMQVKFI